MGEPGREPDRVPVRARVSLGDTLAGQHGVIGVIGVLLAPQARTLSVSADAPRGRGQVVIGGNGDSIFERLMHSIGRDHLGADPHFQARQMIQQITTADGLVLAVPGIVPKLSATPGAIRSLAPTLGQHTAQVLDALRLGADPRPAASGPAR